MNFKERMAFHYSGCDHDYANQHPFLKERELYTAKGFGSLKMSPVNGQAGDKVTLSLTYHVDKKGMGKGDLLKIFIVGFNPLSMFTTDTAQSDAALVTAASNNTKIEVRTHSEFNKREIYVSIEEGILTEGDIIEIIIGANNTLVLSEVARPVTFHAEFTQTDTDDAIARLIDMAVLKVTAGPVKAIRCITAPLVVKNRKRDIIINLVDAYGNRVDCRADIEFYSQTGMNFPENVSIIEGDNGSRILKSSLTITNPGLFRIKGRDRLSNIEFVSAPIRCMENEPEHQLYFGDLHAHDFLSPGLASPMEYYQNAKRQGLDFVTLPIQAQSRNLDAEKWAISTFMTEEFYDPGTFVTIPSFEWQHYAFGHKNVYYLNPDQPYLCPYDEQSDTVEKLYTSAKKSDVLIIPHHPGYKLNCHVPGTDWSLVDESMEPVVEICSCHGSSEKQDSERPLNAPGNEGWYQNALAQGLHIGVVGGSDSHTGNPVNSVREPRPFPGGMTCLYTRELTRRGVFEAIRSRHCYATTGARIILEFEINGFPMGSIIKNSALRSIHISIAGTDSIKILEIIKNNKILHAAHSKSPDLDINYLDQENVRSDEDFYYVKIVQNDGEIVWSSPIWVKGDK